MQFNRLFEGVSEQASSVRFHSDSIQDQWRDEQGTQFIETVNGSLAEDIRQFSEILQRGMIAQKTNDSFQKEFKEYKAESEKVSGEIQQRQTQLKNHRMDLQRQTETLFATNEQSRSNIEKQARQLGQSASRAAKFCRFRGKKK